MSITQHTVKDLFSEVIVNHLQVYDMLNKGIDIEIRNDNDKRFEAKMVQQFFKENYLKQVFTHPYTPQENGHIESFHAILSKQQLLGNSISREASCFDLQSVDPIVNQHKEALGAEKLLQPSV